MERVTGLSVTVDTYREHLATILANGQWTCNASTFRAADEQHRRSQDSFAEMQLWECSAKSCQAAETAALRSEQLAKSVVSETSAHAGEQGPSTAAKSFQEHQTVAREAFVVATNSIGAKTQELREKDRE